MAERPSVKRAIAKQLDPDGLSVISNCLAKRIIAHYPIPHLLVYREIMSISSDKVNKWLYAFSAMIYRGKTFIMKKSNLLLVSLLSVVALASCAARDDGSSTNSAKASDSTNSVVSTNSTNSTNSTDSTSTPVDKKITDGIRVAYAINSHNIIRAEVTAAKGVAEKVHFDEVRFDAPTLMQAVNTEKAADNENLVDVTTTKKSEIVHNYYAKRFNYGGSIFEAKVSGDQGHQTIAYEDKEGTYFDEMLMGDDSVIAGSQALMSDFFADLVNNNIYACDAEGKEVKGLIATIYSKANGDSTYWNTTDFTTLTWKGNISKIEKALVGKNLTKVTAADDSFKLDGVETGATITSFAAYVDLAKSAFDGSSKVVEYFALDHTNCISRTELVVGADKKVAAAHINETNQFMTMLAANPAEGVEKVHFHTDEVKNEDGSIKTAAVDKDFAKYLSVDNTLWTGKALPAAANRENVAYANEALKATDALAYYSSNFKLANDYYNAASLHNIFVADAEGTKVAAVAYGNVTATKAENNNTYWVTGHGAPEDVKPEGYQTWWKWNIAAVEEAFKGVDFSDITSDDAEKAESASADGHKYWSLNGQTTGASMSEFGNYVDFAHAAYGFLIA